MIPFLHPIKNRRFLVNESLETVEWQHRRRRTGLCSVSQTVYRVKDSSWERFTDPWLRAG
ncbi:hypothetical protein HanPSC8_Chr11g0467641 [Helianthus annuus]|nr:hypothetical protein HanIR_Chr11g0522711 [Helianthus annuus]KAJ0874724.1 hypothetical protein HanPSC8_Chr11g0467641 [Helianthus annuus]